MKHIFLILFISICVQLKAQETGTRKIDENTVIKDSGGTVYPFKVWITMIQSNEYGLKLSNPKDKNSDLLIFKLSEKEKQRKDSLQEIMAANSPQPKESGFFKTGEKIKSFKEKDMEGKKFCLKEMKGKVVILNFWFIGCPPCREEIPKLNQTVEKYKNNPDVVFIAIALDDASSLKEFLKTNPFKYHIIDNGRYIAQGIYGINGFPTHVVVDKNGIIRFHTSGLGPGTVHYLKKTIDDILNEK